MESNYLKYNGKFEIFDQKSERYFFFAHVFKIQMNTKKFRYGKTRTGYRNSLFFITG